MLRAQYLNSNRDKLVRVVYGLLHVHVGGAYLQVAPPPFRKENHVVSSLWSQEEVSGEIAMSGEKSLLLVVSPCRGGSTAAREERTDQPNHKVNHKFETDPRCLITSVFTGSVIILHQLVAVCMLALIPLPTACILATCSLSYLYCISGLMDTNQSLW